MKERITYIDSVKGFAILLVVIGHVLAGFWTNFSTTQDLYPNLTIEWRIIYCFHMPLFMLCSGLVFPKTYEWYSLKNVTKATCKRILSLLLPYVSMGLLLLIVGGGYFKYWYLLMLFVFTTINNIVMVGVSKLGKYSSFTEICLYVFISFLILCSYDKLMIYNNPPFIDIEHVNLYPFFCLGIIIRRYNIINKCKQYKNIIYSGTLTLFVLLNYMQIVSFEHLPLERFSWVILPLCGIITTIGFFAYFITNEKIDILFQNMGRHSLEIYLLHLFFLIKIPMMGDFCVGYVEILNDYRGAFLVQFVCSLFISVVIICLCYLLMDIIEKSKILSMILLGRNSSIKIGISDHV